MAPQASTRRFRPELTGFTLIELLVVISIIALLLSLLLPGLSSARRTGQRVACSATLRQISEGMQEYGQDNEDAILGGPFTSGVYLAGVSMAWGPAVQWWDFMGPLAQAWDSGFVLPSMSAPAALVQRFEQIRGSGMFLCPGNRFLSPPFVPMPGLGTGWMVSYNTYRYTLLDEATWASWDHEEKPPRGWKPIISRVGVPADKVYCADGARYIDPANHLQDTDLSLVLPPTYGFGGAFSDSGAYSTYSRSWDRCYAPGSVRHPPNSEARYFAYRHATAEPPDGAPANAFRANFAFYDGHVETQGDLQSATPYQWLPSGSQLDCAGLYPDAAAYYGLSGTITIGQP